MHTKISRFEQLLSSSMSPRRIQAVKAVVNVGAGRCTECVGVLKVFPQARLTLVDRDVGSIEYLRNMLTRHEKRIDIVQDDAGRFLSNNSVMYDLAIVRHPNLSADVDGWGHIFRLIWLRLVAPGTILVSCHSLYELELVERFFSMDGGVTEKRRVRIEAAVPLSGRDRYALVCNKSGV